MNQLRIERREYAYEVKGVAQAPAAQTELLVDGRGLSELFGFEGDRPWFGRSCFETGPALRDRQIEALRGLREAQNQFRSGRFVLYGCHCGSDDCGVISCRILREGAEVRWLDLRYEEGDPTDDPPYAGRIELLRFDAEAYDEAIARYASSL